jgi:hypothetical protein
MAAFLEQGYYDTSQVTYTVGNHAPWIDTQLAGTPEHWVYAYKITPTGHIGYWVDPRHLHELEWKQCTSTRLPATNLAKQVIRLMT